MSEPEEDPQTAEELVLVSRLKQKLSKLQKENKLLISALDKKERAFIAATEVKSVKKKKASGPKRSRKSQLPSASAVLLCSDWHVEENVDPKKVNDLNEYTIDIAGQRIERLLNEFVDKIEMHRSHYDVQEAVVWLGGDLISGYIHDELMETNSMSPTEAILWLQEQLISFIDSLKDSTGLPVRVPCSFGNHGRTNQRKKISTAAENSYEWLLYKTLERHYRGDKFVEIVAEKNTYTYIEAQGKVLRFTHGDTVKGVAGGPGRSVGLAANRWDAMRRADITCVGHWHTYTALPGVVVNGSLIGPGSYSVNMGFAPEEAQQAFFLVTEKGKCCDSPLWVS